MDKMWLNPCLSHAWQIQSSIIMSSSNFIFALFWGSTRAWRDISTLSLPNAIRAARVNQRTCIKEWRSISQPSVGWRQATMLKCQTWLQLLKRPVRTLFSVTPHSVWCFALVCLASVQEVVGTSEESQHHTFPLLPAWWVLLWFGPFMLAFLSFFLYMWSVWLA